MATQSLPTLISRYRTLKDIQAETEKALEGIRTQLLERALKAGGKAETSTHTVKVIEASRRTIMIEGSGGGGGQKAWKGLLELGVTPKVIEAATRVQTYAYAKVTEKKGTESTVEQGVQIA